jgi:hypothetical protein
MHKLSKVQEEPKNKITEELNHLEESEHKINNQKHLKEKKDS